MTLTATEVDVQVGQRLRRQREALGISQGQLGLQLGLTFSQVQKYEKGSNRIGAGRLFLISKYLGVPVEYFYDGLGGTAQATPARHSDVQASEIHALNSAFTSIPDGATRQSVLSLIRSLADATTRSPDLMAPPHIQRPPACYAARPRRAGE